MILENKQLRGGNSNSSHDLIAEYVFKKCLRTPLRFKRRYYWFCPSTSGHKKVQGLPSCPRLKMYQRLPFNTCSGLISIGEGVNGFQIIYHFLKCFHMRVLLFPASGQTFPNVLKFSLAQRSSDTDVSLWWCLVIIRPNYGSPRLWLDKLDFMLKGLGWGGLKGLAGFRGVLNELSSTGVSVMGQKHIAAVDTSEHWGSPKSRWGPEWKQYRSNHRDRCCGERRTHFKNVMNSVPGSFYFLPGWIVDRTVVSDHYLQTERTRNICKKKIIH